MDRLLYRTPFVALCSSFAYSFQPCRATQGVRTCLGEVHVDLFLTSEHRLIKGKSSQATTSISDRGGARVGLRSGSWASTCHQQN